MKLKLLLLKPKYRGYNHLGLLEKLCFQQIYFQTCPDQVEQALNTWFLPCSDGCITTNLETWKGKPVYLLDTRKICSDELSNC